MSYRDRSPLSEVETWLKRGDCALQPGPLGKLPPELLNMIFGNIRLLTDVIRFSITCKLALEVGKRHLLSALQGYHAIWAGTQVLAADIGTGRSTVTADASTADTACGRFKFARQPRILLN